MGVAKDKWYEKQGLSFMRSLSCKMLVMVIGAAEMFLNFDWVPFIIKPFSQGTLSIIFRSFLPHAISDVL